MMTLYRTVEKAFWFTLTRKIIGNVAAMLLPTALLIAGLAYLLIDLRQQLEGQALCVNITLSHLILR